MRALVAAVALGCALPALAAPVRNLLAAGHAAYKEGRYAEAADRYQRAIEAGATGADVFYDLGSAYYRLGKTGRAVLAFERALSREPRHEDARVNLAIAHRRLGLEKAVQELGLPREGLLRRLARATTADEVAMAFLAVYYLFFAVLALRHFRRPGTARSLLGLAALTLLLCSLTLGSFFAYRVYRQERVTEGVILEPKVSLMEPHAGTWKAVRSLPEGLRVAIETRNESWVKIRLPGGLSGFVRESQVESL
jgi:tetratricopeptide (TPR) repeat protein